MSVYASSYAKIVAAIKDFFVKKLLPGQPMPRFYGFGWYEYSSQAVYSMPMGLNLIVSGVRALYYGTIYGFRSRTESYVYKTAFMMGSGNGFKQGYFKGYSDGKNGLPNAILAAVDAVKKEQAGVGTGSGQ